MVGNAGNRNPYAGRLAQALARQAACEEDLDKARLALNKAIERNLILLDSPSPDVVQRSTHALSQAAGSLLRIVHALELNGRVTELEERIAHALRPRAVPKTA